MHYCDPRSAARGLSLAISWHHTAGPRFYEDRNHIVGIHQAASLTGFVSQRVGEDESQLLFQIKIIT